MIEEIRKIGTYVFVMLPGDYADKVRMRPPSKFTVILGKITAIAYNTSIDEWFYVIKPDPVLIEGAEFVVLHRDCFDTLEQIQDFIQGRENIIENMELAVEEAEESITDDR